MMAISFIRKLLYRGSRRFARQPETPSRAAAFRRDGMAVSEREDCLIADVYRWCRSVHLDGSELGIF
jgi:hypothetical protein